MSPRGSGGGGAPLLRSLSVVAVLLLCPRPCSPSPSPSSAGHLDKVELGAGSRLTCAQVLTDCRVTDELIGTPSSGPVDLGRVELRAVLCCTAGAECVPCMKIVTHLTVTERTELELLGDDDDDDDDDNDSEHVDDIEGGDDDEYDRTENEGKEEGSVSGPDAPPTLPGEKRNKRKNATLSLQLSGPVPVETGATLPPAARSAESPVSLRVCHGVPHLFPTCKRVEFTVPAGAAQGHEQPEVWFSLVVSEKVLFDSQVTVWVLQQNFSLTFPSKKDVCSPALHQVVTHCDVPALRTVIDRQNAAVTLQLDDRDARRALDVGLCIKYGDRDRCSYRQWKSTEKITLPLSSVVPCMCFQVWWIQKDSLRVQMCPFLNRTEFLQNVWDNISVSVRPSQTHEDEAVLEWTVSAPCRLEAELWPCRMGAAEASRCREVEGMRQSLQGERQKSGWFFHLQPHPSLCAQMKVKGKDVELGPYCPLASARSRWSLVVLFVIMVVCIGILAMYLLHGTLKRLVSRWFKDSSIRGAVEGGQVLLLCPPDSDPRVAALVCQLGSSLSHLGFCVSLELWSRRELSALGPVPWLHSRLDRLQRHGGKAALLLTQAAWQRAHEWARSEPESAPRSPARTDVFGASLSCVAADRLQGRAGERFVLARFEALPPVPLGAGQPLPEPFRGLALYSLPSQSLGFLTELAGAAGGRGQSRRRRAGGLRAASRALALGLRATGTSGGGDTWETVPLQRWALEGPDGTP
ncbi:uncharacterized protein LOC114910601 [Scleropages formosus]|uniref:Uncharacterized LOC114910601 n=1 Tax=Scleropages formosus TaxID=113540 RepID=A0A8C9VI45_SCLFO|nr:uncharacterized protein LOC114910601 [Scleropages formosus]XP_029108320.1 uncharacterized protein LOC114910601 [Scleropages formosus]